MTGELQIPERLEFDQEVEYVFTSTNTEEQYYDILNGLYGEKEKTKLIALKSWIQKLPWGTQGEAKPEYLKHERSGWLSRHMIGENRMVYKCLGTKPKGIYEGMGYRKKTYKVLVGQLFGHYDD